MTENQPMDGAGARPSGAVGAQPDLNRFLLFLPIAALLALGELIHFRGLNVELFLAMNSAGTRFPAALWSNLTVLGDTLVVLALLTPFARRYPQVIWAGFVAALFATAYVHGLKPWFELPRPAAVLPPGSFEQIGPTLRRNAFPSGHTATAFTVAGIWILFLRSAPLRIAIALLAIVVGLSRIMVGVHWPLDVVFGALGGWGAAAIGAYLSSRWTWGLTRGARRAQLLLLIVASIAVVRHDGGYHEASWLTWTVGAIGMLTGGAQLYLLHRERGADSDRGQIGVEHQ